jgi:cyclohexanecarboxylate-CoA ligase
MTATIAESMLLVHAEQAHRYRDNGWWRDRTFLDDLDNWARLQPDAPAFFSGRADGSVQVLTYRDFDRRVRRIARSLHDLGVRAGDVVAFQFPDWWEAAALLIATMRAGAIAQPMMPDLRAREIERALTRTGACVCVMVDEWAGFDHSAALAEMAPRLPSLRHRVIHGDSARTGALDFHECLLGGDQDPDVSVLPALDPDNPCLVLFTSGSTGEAKGVLHSLNTIYAGTSSLNAVTLGDFTPGTDRAAGTLRLTHIAGPLWMVFGTLLSGGAGISLDVFDPDRMLDLMEAAGVTRLLSSPPKLAALVEAQRRRPRPLTALHTITAGGSAVPTELVPAVREAFGVPLRTVWGMTEIVVGTAVGVDDPPDWSAHSDGRVLAGLELRIVTDGTSPIGVGSLQVRGAALCLGVLTGGGEIVPTAGEDGWFDTGDLARPDGAGGIRLAGRIGDRMYDRAVTMMIPVRDVEEELLLHPSVLDVALIAAADGEEEDVCAVVVPAPSGPPTLDGLRGFLRDRGMTEAYYPDRLELVDALPRDGAGKIRKYQLRERFGRA